VFQLVAEVSRAPAENRVQRQRASKRLLGIGVPRQRAQHRAPVVAATCCSGEAVCAIQVSYSAQRPRHPRCDSTLACSAGRQIHAAGAGQRHLLRDLLGDFGREILCQRGQCITGGTALAGFSALAARCFAVDFS